MFPRLKAHIDRKTEENLAQMPLHEQDQINEAAKTFRGTVRYLLDNFKRTGR